MVFQISVPSLVLDLVNIQCIVFIVNPEVTCHVYTPHHLLVYLTRYTLGWLGSQVVGILDSGAEGPG